MNDLAATKVNARTKHKVRLEFRALRSKFQVATAIGQTRGLRALDKPAGACLHCEPMSLNNQPLAIAGRIFRSRLILGTGKFSSPEAMRDAMAARANQNTDLALAGKQVVAKLTHNFLSLMFSIV